MNTHSTSARLARLLAVCTGVLAGAVLFTGTVSALPVPAAPLHTVISDITHHHPIHPDCVVCIW